MEMFFYLLVGHALADYPLQGDFLSKAKNRANPIPGVPWYQGLISHSFIHGGVVALVTGIWWLGLMEVVCHAFIDDAKCTNKIGFNADQALHIGCKAIWCVIALYLIGGPT